MKNLRDETGADDSARKVKKVPTNVDFEQRLASREIRGSLRVARGFDVAGLLWVIEQLKALDGKEIHTAERR